MVDTNKLLSDLLDENCSSNNLDDLLEDKHAIESWYRYHSISEIIKGQNSADASLKFCQQISAKIADEPAIIAAPRQESSHPVNAQVVPLNAEIKKVGGGFAIAASVAVATFFSFQSTQIAQHDAPQGTQVASKQQASPENTVATNPTNQQMAAAEQYQMDIFNDRYIRDLRRSDKGNIAPVSGEFVRTMRFSAEEWQAILEKSLEQQRQLEKAKLEKSKD